MPSHLLSSKNTVLTKVAKVAHTFIKRNKKRKDTSGGGHASAWKIAHADFMTTLMAFFLIMWLVNTMSVEQRKEFSEYFDPITKNEISTNDRNYPTEGEIVTTPAYPLYTNPVSGKYNQLSLKEEEHLFQNLTETLNKTLHQGSVPAEVVQNVAIERIPEGLRIQVMDSVNAPMFASGSSFLYANTQVILKKIALSIQALPHKIIVVGHTDAFQYLSSKTGYTNWNLSSDRANMARGVITEVIGAHRIHAIVGKADTDPLDPQNPKSPRNRRIDIILLSLAKP